MSRLSSRRWSRTATRDRIVLGQDVGVRTRLRRWGGWGYAHLLEHVVPLLRELGVDDDVARTRCSSGNPARLLAVPAHEWSGHGRTARDGRLDPALAVAVVVSRHLQRVPVDRRRARAPDRFRFGRDPRRARPDRRPRDRRRRPHPSPSRPVRRRRSRRRPRHPDLGARPGSGPCSSRPRRSGRLRRTYDSYDVSSLGFTRASSVPVARGLVDLERVDWAGGTFEVVPTPGHTKGSISLAGRRSTGRSVAFTGDLIAGHGRVPTLHDLQWQYGMPDAVGAALHSATALAKRAPAPPPAVPRRADGRRRGRPRALADQPHGARPAPRRDPPEPRLDDLAEQRRPAARARSCRTCGSTPTASRTRTRSSTTPVTR